MENKWIKTTDALPKGCGEVLAIVNGIYKNIQFKDAIQIAELIDEGWYIFEFPEWENAEVSYWMPLPATPAEVENGDCDIDFSAILPDSGMRREFESGAVRDICEGKGRCDLMPLDVIADIYDRYLPESPELANIFRQMHFFREDGDISHLQSALWTFIGWREWNGWCDMLLELALHFEAGAEKYGEHNWQRGIPVHCYTDSALRHFFKYLRGDADEPHDRAFCWNLMCCIWTMKHRPECDDFTTKKEENKNDQT